ncbi:MAG: hypothetical protein HC915_13450, partial [Anaerolineae bacterium]|nr:hypothetical protein [Anaerolineae bacterium]
MQLMDALGVRRGDLIAFTGAGGKTSALRRLSQELHVAGWRVLVTTTTRMAETELRYFPQSVPLGAIASPQALSQL